MNPQKTLLFILNYQPLTVNLHAHSVTAISRTFISKTSLLRESTMSNSKLILAKANHLKTLEDIIKHAEVFQAALCDQSSLQQQHNSHFDVDVSNNLKH